MIFGDFFKSLAQLSDRRFRLVLWKGVGLSFLLLFGIYVVFVTGINWFVPESVTLPWVGNITVLKSIFSWASILLMILLSMFLMIPVASAFTGFFLDEVAEAVEDKHYPQLPPAPKMPFADTVVDTVNFLGLIVGLNIVGLVVFPFFGPLAPIMFLGLNGFLLGREYFQMAAMRRLGRVQGRALMSKNRGEIWIAGALMALPLLIPFVNLFVPVLAAATFTHMFQRLRP
ncbi:EI24 domain-containing protein [Falsihalocynthiibacter sp. BN13B15]|uniref:EI24 domain-containing protein n=1 Tax=Falsihalocynthiibacter sp. BN13B15 TaxID=3240871 RepID=UPI00350F6355